MRAIALKGIPRGRTSRIVTVAEEPIPVAADGTEVSLLLEALDAAGRSVWWDGVGNGVRVVVVADAQSLIRVE